MKTLKILFLTLPVFFASSILTANVAASDSHQTIHHFKVEDIQGKVFDLADLAGNKVMIVNTASKCGLTPQYEQLEKLYNEYKDKNFVIVGFPANNFMNQEPGTNEEIAEFCQINYGVTFPMMSKISVKGDDISPLFHWLTSKSLNGVMDVEVTWNFQKFLIDEEGKLVGFLTPRESPFSEKVVEWLAN